MLLTTSRDTSDQLRCNTADLVLETMIDDPLAGDRNGKHEPKRK